MSLHWVYSRAKLFHVAMVSHFLLVWCGCSNPVPTSTSNESLFQSEQNQTELNRDESPIDTNRCEHATRCQNRQRKTSIIKSLGALCPTASC